MTGDSIGVVTREEATSHLCTGSRPPSRFAPVLEAGQRLQTALEGLLNPSSTPPEECGCEPGLEAAHLADLRRSGLSDATIRAAGFRSIDADEARRVLGYNEAQGDHAWPGPGMLIPFPDCDGYGRVKPTTPAQMQDGSTAKYLTPKGQPNRLYLPPLNVVQDNLGNVQVPLLVGEGEKKVLKLAQENFCACGLVGIYGWKLKDEERLLPDFDKLVLQGRIVTIVWDSDSFFNWQFADATARLAKLLQARGAQVRLARLAPTKWPTKIGVDDWFVSRETQNA